MHGTIAFKIRGESPGGFIARISIPSGTLANMTSFFKVLNCIRTDNMNITHDSFHTSESLLRDIKMMIQRANEAACVGLVQLGAAVKVNTVVKPRVDLDTYYHHETAGQTDGLTLTLQDIGSSRTYLDIHGAIRASPTTEVTKSVLTTLCALVLSSMANATWDDLQEAMGTMVGRSIAR